MERDIHYAHNLPEAEELSRRSFLKGAGVALGGLGASAVMAACSPSTDGDDTTDNSSTTTGDNVSERVTTELPIPEVAPPSQTKYDCDVLVAGGGYAGLFAATAAHEAGKKVLLVDKGQPGYSGLSAWPSSHNYFDESLSDSAEQFEYAMMYSNEFLCNLDWNKVWERESKGIFEKCTEWGILDQYPTGQEEGFWVDGSTDNDKLVAYHEKYASYDRRAKVIPMLQAAGIEYLAHTMVVDVVEDDGKVVGAMGLDVKSGTVLTFNAKAVVLCTGTGSYKPAGFPTSGDTFDGEYIGYMHGLPVTGQEFEDFHMTASFAPGNVLSCNSWQYLECVWPCAPGGTTPEGAAQKAAGSARSVITPVFDSAYGLVPLAKTEMTEPKGRGGAGEDHPDDPRQGKWSSPIFKGDVFAAAPGMYSHNAGGIFCGIDDLEGKTAISGLWVAGDGINGSMAAGPTKGAPAGWTSNFAGVQGKIAGAAAAAYVDNVASAAIPADKAVSLSDGILAPLSMEKGYDPNWARDELAAIMTPFWITIAKNETALKNALDRVQMIRDEIVPKLRAASGHDLRLCHEMRHKVLIAELKLRASLERKESRGYHFRSDYPYRDDNYLCFITLQKGNGNEVKMDKVAIKDAWKGDLNMPYTERYGGYRFPGETEAKNLPPLEGGSSR